MIHVKFYRSTTEAATTGPPSVETGQQFHGRGGHTRAHPRMRAICTVLAAFRSQWRRGPVTGWLTEGQQPGPGPVGDGRCTVAAAAAAANAATATAATIVRQRLRVRLSLLCAARGRPPDCRAQVGGHVAHTGVPPHATAATAVGRRAAHVLVVGRHTAPVAQRPRAVLGLQRVTAAAAAAAAVAVAARLVVRKRRRRAGAATATAAVAAARRGRTEAPAAAAAPVRRQLRVRD